MIDRDLGSFHDVRVGMDVFTNDNDLLGQVREIHGGYFKVNAAMQPDYWLATSLISSTTGDRVLLTIDKAHLGDHKESEPRAA